MKTRAGLFIVILFFYTTQIENFMIEQLKGLSFLARIMTFVRVVYNCTKKYKVNLYTPSRYRYRDESERKIRFNLEIDNKTLDTVKITNLQYSYDIGFFSYYSKKNIKEVGIAIPRIFHIGSHDSIFLSQDPFLSSTKLNLTIDPNSKNVVNCYIEGLSENAFKVIISYVGMGNSKPYNKKEVIYLMI
jgi:hypothetical protein